MDRFIRINDVYFANALAVQFISVQETMAVTAFERTDTKGDYQGRLRGNVQSRHCNLPREINRFPNSIQSRTLM